MKQVLFTNRELPSYEDYKEWCITECDMEENEIPSEESSEFSIWRYQENDADWEDFQHIVKEYDKDGHKGNGYLVEGVLDLWDGKKEMQPTLFNTLEEVINKCTNNCDYIEIAFDDEKKVLEVSATHHDGTNKFVVSEVNYEIDCVGIQDIEKIPIGIWEL